jgi:hypothetical protein
MNQYSPELKAIFAHWRISTAGIKVPCMRNIAMLLWGAMSTEAWEAVMKVKLVYSSICCSSNLVFYLILCKSAI